MALVLVAVILTGCATTSSEDRNFKTVSIISDPPGAKIEVNGSYIGQAPITTKVKCWPDDKVVVGTLTVKALPSGANQYLQQKVFKGPAYPFDPNHDVVPDTILFQMNLPTANSN